AWTGPNQVRTPSNEPEGPASPPAEAFGLVGSSCSLPRAAHRARSRVRIAGGRRASRRPSAFVAPDFPFRPRGRPELPVDLLGPRGLRGPGRRTPAGSSRDVPAGAGPGLAAFA